MKKRFAIILVGLPVALILGFVGYCHFIFVAFENRESHNGVGYSAFRKSITKHVKSGPNRLTDMRSYEGTWWFTITAPDSQSYNVTIGRESYVDARDMQSLKGFRLSIKQIKGEDLICENNFGETVHTNISLSDLGVSESTPSSLNAVIDDISPLVSRFAESLPHNLTVSKGQLRSAPEWLKIPLKRYSGDCGTASETLEPPTSVTCRLVVSKTGEIAIN